MYKILPDAEKERQKKKTMLDNIADIMLIILATSALIAIWVMFNQRMGNQAWQEGYDRGYEQSQWDYIDREINSRDYGTIRVMPETDAKIWETYHDCNMYGLPEYARPYCEQEKTPDA